MQPSEGTIRYYCKQIEKESSIIESHVSPHWKDIFEWFIDNDYVQEVDENEYGLTEKGELACFDSAYIIQQTKNIFAEWGIPVDDYEWEHAKQFVTHTVYGVYKKTGNRVTLTDVYIRTENSEILQSTPILG